MSRASGLTTESEVEPEIETAAREEMVDWESVVLALVRTANADAGPACDESGSWIDALQHPERGAMAWLAEIGPSARLMAELEGLPEHVVADDYDAAELVAHWHRLEAHCAAQKRLTAAALARRSAMADGLAHLDGLGVVVNDPNIAGDELALRLGITLRAARRLITSGRAMSGVGVLTAEALEAGEIDAVKADAILDAVTDLSPDAALEVQERVLSRSAHLPAGRVRRELAEACARVDPDEFESRCAAAARARRVDRPRVLRHGMASLYAVLPAAAATRLYRGVDAAARSASAAGDPRTMDQLRADALALMGATAIETGWIGPCPYPHGSLDGPGRPPSQPRRSPPGRPGCSDGPATGPPGPGGHDGGARTGPARHGGDAGAGPPGPRRHDGDAGTGPPGHGDDPPAGTGPPGHGDDPPAGTGPPGMRVGVIGGRSAQIRVTVPLSALMGGRGGPADGAPETNDPATLEDYGPIPASVARALAAGGVWQRMVTDPLAGLARDLSTDSYRPPRVMADLVRAGQTSCARPGCGVGADACDLNHRIPWPEGPTAIENLDPQCRRDHLLLTHARWSYHQDEKDRSRVWSTATGHRYRDEPDGSLTMLPASGNPSRRMSPHSSLHLPADSIGSAPRPLPRSDEPPPF